MKEQQENGKKQKGGNTTDCDGKNGDNLRYTRTHTSKGGERERDPSKR